MKKSKIISAFPGCGKSYFFNTWSIYSTSAELIENINLRNRILDLDSSDFSWIKDVQGNNTDVRNPDFPNNYIQCIKEKSKTEEIIFISSHKEVRDALEKENISYSIVYPDKTLKDSYISRYRSRGDSEKFIQFMSNNFENFIDEIEKESFPKKIKLLSANCGIDWRLVDQTVLDEFKDKCEVCGEVAIWCYGPTGDNYCDECVPRGCTHCNVYKFSEYPPEDLLSPNLVWWPEGETEFEPEDSSKDPVSEGYWAELDEKGRFYPCAEYLFSEFGWGKE